MVQNVHIASDHFNSQPREGGWDLKDDLPGLQGISTHSRAKAAGKRLKAHELTHAISTHSRAKAAGVKTDVIDRSDVISTHSRAKAAG